MNILKRTQGIDARAKSGALRGDVCFQLRDVDTGKVKEEFRGHNMLTNGLDNALNGCPFGIDRQDVGYNGTDGVVNYLTPIYQQLLGGVILFPSALGNDADLLYPDFDNSPTAFASCASYTQDDNRQGAYDSVSSQIITNGFKHSFSWGSAYGNGTVASLGLAPKNAHTWCYGHETMVLPVMKRTGYDYGGYRTMYESNGYHKALSASPKGTLIVTSQESLDTLYFFGWHRPNNVALTCDLVTNTRFDLANAFDDSHRNGYTWKATRVFATERPAGLNNLSYLSAQIIGDYVYVLEHNGWTTANNNVFTLVKLSLADGSEISRNTYTFSGSFSYSKAVYYDGYIIAPSTVAGKVYKCNTADTTDVTEIADASIPANCDLHFVGNQFIYSQYFMVDADTSKAVGFSGQLFSQMTPIYDSGMWLISRYEYRQSFLYAGLKQWGLMTHYDLPASVTKDATKQMVVNYSITQV